MDMVIEMVAHLAANNRGEMANKLLFCFVVMCAQHEEF